MYVSSAALVSYYLCLRRYALCSVNDIDLPNNITKLSVFSLYLKLPASVTSLPLITFLQSLQDDDCPMQFANLERCDGCAIHRLQNVCIFFLKPHLMARYYFQ